MQRSRKAAASAVGKSAPHDTLAFQQTFMARLQGGSDFRFLFDHLPDVHFFAKDAEGRFICGSQGLLKRLGLASERDLVGLTDADIHPASVAAEIREDDLRVIHSKVPIIGRIEALFTRSHAKDWYVTTKLPMLDAQGHAIGVMGFVRPYRIGDVAVPGAERLERVVAYIQAHHAQSIVVEELARLANLSVRHLHRKFREVFGMSTQTFIVRTRVQAASDDLLLTEKALSEIALDHGFCDQSAFCRRFYEHTGETPLRFRQRHRGRSS